MIGYSQLGQRDAIKALRQKNSARKMGKEVTITCPVLSQSSLFELVIVSSHGILEFFMLISKPSLKYSHKTDKKM